MPAAPASIPPRPEPRSLSERYARIRAATEALAAPLSAEDCCVQSMPDASPTKWHLAHTSWFFETFVLGTAVPGHRVFEPLFRVLFNSYYDGVGAQHPRAARGMLTRPDLATVRAYRAQVDAAMARLLEAGVDPDVGARIELGLHHEQQHQELLLTDAKHLLAQSPFAGSYRDDLVKPPPRTASPLRWHRFDGGIREVGYDGPGFCFDNEGPRHPALLAPFELASRPVTSGEFLAFVEAGGYAQSQWWLADGLAAARAAGWEAPAYWSRRDGAWHERTLGGWRPLDLDAPVCHVGYYEADAFARFSDARLPTEAEWEVAAAQVPVRGNLVEADHLHPVAAEAMSGPVPAQLFGDVWEWTQSPYVAYPGFRPAAGAIGEYNGKFMCNQFVLRGGSCATPADHVRASYRNFFPPGARWQFSGLRLARDFE